MSIAAALVPIQILGEMTSIGTLFAFMIVCSAVMVLRMKRPDAHRPFRVPADRVIPVLGIVSCLYLMLSLPVATWVRFLGWLEHRHADLLVLRPRPQPAASMQREAAARTGLENLATS